MKNRSIQTSWGEIAFVLDENGCVTSCTLPFLQETPRLAFQMDGFQSLDDFLQTFPTLGKLKGTEFQRKVWRALQQIPYGQTRTYGEIAAAIGNPKAVRAVGSACGANPLPLFIPCHRVVAAHGGLGGFGCGLPWKKMLLNRETSRPLSSSLS